MRCQDTKCPPALLRCHMSNTKTQKLLFSLNTSSVRKKIEYFVLLYWNLIYLIATLPHFKLIFTLNIYSVQKKMQIGGFPDKSWSNWSCHVAKLLRCHMSNTKLISLSISPPPSGKMQIRLFLAWFKWCCHVANCNMLIKSRFDVYLHLYI